MGNARTKRYLISHKRDFEMSSMQKPEGGIGSLLCRAARRIQEDSAQELTRLRDGIPIPLPPQDADQVQLQEPWSRLKEQLRNNIEEK